MTHHKQIGLFAQAENDKAVLLFRMLGIVNYQRFFVIEYRLSLLEGYSMLALIDFGFVLVPLKPYHIHTYIIIMLYVFVNGIFA